MITTIKVFWYIWTDCLYLLGLVKAPSLFLHDLRSHIQFENTKKKSYKYIQWSEEVDGGGCSFSDLRSLASVSDKESVSWACCCFIHMSAYKPPLTSSSSCLRWRERGSYLKSSVKNQYDIQNKQVTHLPSSLGNAAVTDHQDLVRSDYGGQPFWKIHTTHWIKPLKQKTKTLQKKKPLLPVSHDNGCTVGTDFSQRRLDVAFRLCVQCRCCLQIDIICYNWKETAVTSSIQSGTRVKRGILKSTVDQ